MNATKIRAPFPLRNPLPYSKGNHPREYDDLPECNRYVLQEWTKECLEPVRTKNYYPYRTSYGLKHKFNGSNSGFYVTNGQFKGAMFEAGFEPEKVNTLNWTFKIGKKRINRDLEIPIV